MSLQQISQFVVDDLHALQLLDGRFEGMELVNYDSIKDERRGCLSLVFRANDRDTGRYVALKFFDPARMNDVYRLNAFRREHEILKGLLGVNRCLQLASGLNTYQLQVPVSNGQTISLPCEYFAIEWITDEVDKYFFCQERYSAVEKLGLFSGIAFSVNVLHSNDVFHRDLKPDNLRHIKRNGKLDVVAIDLGTAAKFSSNPIQMPYFESAGAPTYASPEARCGLAGNRRLARYTDMYALGCMLFELFNKDFYLKGLLARNSTFPVLLAALGGSVKGDADEHEQEEAWISAIGTLGNSVVPVPIDGAGSDVPPGIAPMLNELLFGLTHFDYRRRPHIGWVIKRVTSAIKVLENEKLYQARLERSRELRRRRVEKVHQREARIQQAREKQLKELIC